MKILGFQFRSMIWGHFAPWSSHSQHVNELLIVRDYIMPKTYIEQNIYQDESDNMYLDLIKTIARENCSLVSGVFYVVFCHSIVLFFLISFHELRVVFNYLYNECLICSFSISWHFHHAAEIPIMPKMILHNNYGDQIWRDIHVVLKCYFIFLFASFGLWISNPHGSCDW